MINGIPGNTALASGQAHQTITVTRQITAIPSAPSDQCRPKFTHIRVSDGIGMVERQARVGLQHRAASLVPQPGLSEAFEIS